MGTITDDIGVWNDLGTLQPTTLNEWVKFPSTAVGGNATLRVTFFCTDFSKVRSSCWFRPNYKTANTDQVGRAIRLYPKPERILLDIPVPEELQERSVFFRDFQLLKTLRLRKRPGITPDIPWSIKLEELWG